MADHLVETKRTLNGDGAGAGGPAAGDSLLATLGLELLSPGPVAGILKRAVAVTAEALAVDCVVLLEGDGEGLTVRAVAGWAGRSAGDLLRDPGARSLAADLREAARPLPPGALPAHIAATFAGPDGERRFGSGAFVTLDVGGRRWGILAALTAPDRAVGAVAAESLARVAEALGLFLERAGERAAADRERDRLLQLVDALPMRLSVVSADGRYLFNNRAYESLGQPREALRGQPIEQVMGEKAAEDAASYIAAALGGEGQTFEIEIGLPGQEPQTSLVSLVPRRNDEGRPNGFFSAAVDITRQKRTEYRLAESVAQYRTIGESIPFGVWICDARGRLTYISPSFLQMVGRTMEEVAAYGWADRLVPDTAEKALSSWEDCVARGSNWELEHRFLAADGTVRAVLSIGRPVRDAAGRITSWVGLNLDITERKQEEERIKAISAELDHRVKNILAVVNSMVRMTGRRARSREEYRTKLEARIQAMARAHTTLAEVSWAGMTLKRLVGDELAPYRQSMEERIEVAGPNVMLVPEAAQALTLATHELTTNALKYGALSKDDGQLSVTWSAEEEAKSGLVFEWRERGLVGLRTPKRKGFGTTVIGQVLRAQLNAEVDLVYRSTGLTCRVVIPPKWFRWN